MTYNKGDKFGTHYYPQKTFEVAEITETDVITTCGKQFIMRDTFPIQQFIPWLMDKIDSESTRRMELEDMVSSYLLRTSWQPFNSLRSTWNKYFKKYVKD